jgi:hypothetical protein
MIHECYSIEYPSKLLLCLGCLCNTTLILIVFTAYIVYDFDFISSNMLNHVWYNGTITVLILLVHAIWAHMIWVLSIPPFYDLVIAYSGILLLIVAWVMDVVVPVLPDPGDLHGKFCIIVVIGCTINFLASVYLLPNGRGYKRAMGFLGFLGFLSSSTWYFSRILQSDISNVLTEPFMETVAYLSYLCSLLIAFLWVLLSYMGMGSKIISISHFHKAGCPPLLSFQ